MRRSRDRSGQTGDPCRTHKGSGMKSTGTEVRRRVRRGETDLVKRGGGVEDFRWGRKSRRGNLGRNEQG